MSASESCALLARKSTATRRVRAVQFLDRSVGTLCRVKPSMETPMQSLRRRCATGGSSDGRRGSMIGDIIEIFAAAADGESAGCIVILAILCVIVIVFCWYMGWLW